MRKDCGAPGCAQLGYELFMCRSTKQHGIFSLIQPILTKSEACEDVAGCPVEWYLADFAPDRHRVDGHDRALAVLSR